jgi:hypothetical protein
MTAVQKLARRRSENGGTPSWDEASAPAQVARKALLLVGVDPPPSWIPVLTNAMHWGYGTTWGIVYGLARGRREARRPLLEGLGLGAVVWSASYLELVPLGLYEPPWKYDVQTVALDVGYHVAFGEGATAALAVLSGR